jgi:hypothetical protein
VHGLALASVLTLGGIDVRFAILPSLIGWAATIALSFLIALRLLPHRRSGLTAGALAVTFALASPAFRLITADVMLEGLGAALTEDLMEQEMRLIKAMGVNFIRLGHYQQSRHVLAACDELGEERELARGGGGDRGPDSDQGL